MIEINLLKNVFTVFCPQISKWIKQNQNKQKNETKNNINDYNYYYSYDYWMKKQKKDKIIGEEYMSCDIPSTMKPPFKVGVSMCSQMTDNLIVGLVKIDE